MDFVQTVDTRDKMANILKESIDETIAELEKILPEKQRIFFQNNKKKFFVGALAIISIEAFILIGGWGFIKFAYQYLGF